MYSDSIMRAKLKQANHVLLEVTRSGLELKMAGLLRMNLLLSFLVQECMGQGQGVVVGDW